MKNLRLLIAVSALASGTVWAADQSGRSPLQEPAPISTPVLDQYLAQVAQDRRTSTEQHPTVENFMGKGTNRKSIIEYCVALRMQQEPQAPQQQQPADDYTRLGIGWGRAMPVPHARPQTAATARQEKKEKKEEKKGA